MHKYDIESVRSHEIDSVDDTYYAEELPKFSATVTTSSASDCSVGLHAMNGEVLRVLWFMKPGRSSLDRHPAILESVYIDADVTDMECRKVDIGI